MPDQTQDPLQAALVQRKLIDLVPQSVKDSNPWGMPMIGGTLGPAFNSVEDALNYEPEFQQWKGLKNLKEAAKGILSKFQGMPQDSSSLTTPVTGSPLYNSLQNAALKSGTGEATQPQEGALLKQYVDQILNRYK